LLIRSSRSISIISAGPTATPSNAAGSVCRELLDASGGFTEDNFSEPGLSRYVSKIAHLGLNHAATPLKKRILEESPPLGAEGGAETHFLPGK
jgi:hypothetical protein